MKLRAAAVLLTLAAAPLRADFHALWPMDGSLAGINSSSPARSAEDNLKSNGAELHYDLNPILGWDGSRWLILPALELDYNSANTVLKVDDQRFEFLEQATTRLELGGAFKRTPDQRFGIRLAGYNFQAKQAANEQLATGVYNYQDGELSLDWRQKWDTSTPFRSTLGLTFTDRKYPNWQSLDPGQRSEKDQDITKVYSDMEWAWNSIKASTLFGVSLQSVQYASGLTIDETGTTANAVKRRDSVFDVNLGVPMQLGKHGINTGLSFEFWDSNLNVYDSQTGDYIADYNDFVDATLDLGYSYDFDGPWVWGVFDSPQLSLDVSLELRQYLKRPAKQSDGTLQDAAERDFTRNVTLGFNSALSQHWAFFSEINVQSAASNNGDQSSALYNYALNTFQMGFNFIY